MNRRSFISYSIAAASGLILSPGTSAVNSTVSLPHYEFKLKYAPHFGMFTGNAGKNRFDQLQFMHDIGFRALECNDLMKQSIDFQEKLGAKLRELDMTMGVFVIDGGDIKKASLTSGKIEFVNRFVQTCQEAVEVAARVGAKWMTVVPGFYDRSIPIGIQSSNVIKALREGTKVLEPHNLTMVLEPLSDTPELFLRTAHQAYMICTAVNSSSCKILYDVYHMQRNEGDLIRNIDLCWDQIAYFQVGDVPGRKEPTSGEINYKNLFKHLYERGFDGIVGMEHGNLYPGKEGELAVIAAYAEVDNF